MDPLSLSASIAAIVSIFGNALKILNGCCSTYAIASVIITSIYSETSIITTSLARIQTLIDRHPEVVCSHLTSQPQLLTTFDIALTGCKVIATYLESELRKLSGGTNNGSADVDRSARAKFVLNEDTLKELLQSIRGQQQALTLLIQAIQMESISEMRILLQNQAAAFQQVARRTKSLRSSNREISQLVPESIFSGSESQSQTSEDRLSSTIGSAEFSFDDTIVNSTVYRKALAAILQRSRQKRRKMGFKNENLRDQKPQVDILTVIRCDTCGDLLSHRIKGLNGVNERVLQTECRHLHHELCLFNQLLVMGPSRMCCPTCARPSGVNLTFMNDSHFARRRQDDLRTRQTTAA